MPDAAVAHPAATLFDSGSYPHSPATSKLSAASAVTRPRLLTFITVVDIRSVDLGVGICPAFASGSGNFSGVALAGGSWALSVAVLALYGKCSGDRLPSLAVMVARTLQAGIVVLGYNPWQHLDKPSSIPSPE